MKHILYYIKQLINKTFGNGFTFYPNHAKSECRNSYLEPGQVIWCSFNNQHGTVQERDENLKPYRGTDYLVLFENGDLKIADDKWLWTDKEIEDYSHSYPVLMDHDWIEEPIVKFNPNGYEIDYTEVTIQFKAGEKVHSLGYVLRVKRKHLLDEYTFVLSEPKFLTKSSVNTIQRYLTAMNKKIKGGRYDGSITR